jgi:hypothetical protein
MSFMTLLETGVAEVGFCFPVVAVAAMLVAAFCSFVGEAGGIVAEDGAFKSVSSSSAAVVVPFPPFTLRSFWPLADLVAVLEETAPFGLAVSGA